MFYEIYNSTLMFYPPQIVQILFHFQKQWNTIRVLYNGNGHKTNKVVPFEKESSQYRKLTMPSAWNALQNWTSKVCKDYKERERKKILLAIYIKISSHYPSESDFFSVLSSLPVLRDGLRRGKRDRKLFPWVIKITQKREQ